MARLKWVPDPALPGVYRSACGRFVAGGTLYADGGRATYVRLYDGLTGRVYPCRSLASAKANARNLASGRYALRGAKP